MGSILALRQGSRRIGYEKKLQNDIKKLHQILGQQMTRHKCERMFFRKEAIEFALDFYKNKA